MTFFLSLTLKFKQMLISYRNDERCAYGHFKSSSATEDPAGLHREGSGKSSEFLFMSKFLRSTLMI